MDMLTYSLVTSTIFLVVVLLFSLQIEEMRKRHHKEMMELVKLVKAESLVEYQSGKAAFPKNENYIKEAIQSSYRRDADADE